MRRLLLLLPLAALAGCGLGDDGPQTTQTRDLPGFTRIDNDSSVDVHLRVGSPQRVEVRAGEKVLGKVKTEVTDDGTLKIDYDHSGFGGGADLVVTVPKLEGVKVDGSGDFDAQGVEADSFEVRSDGSASIDVAGTAQRLVVDLDGSGEAHLEELTADEATVKVGGSGGADVNASKNLDVSIDGSGDVRYHGDPALTRRVDGSGDVERAG